MVQATFSWLGVSATVNFSFLATLTVVSSRQFLFWKCIASKQQLHHSGQISCAFLPHYSDSVEPECSEQFFDGEKSIAVQGIASMMKPWGCPSFETCYHCSVIFGCFRSRFYIVILGMTFFLVSPIISLFAQIAIWSWISSSWISSKFFFYKKWKHTSSRRLLIKDRVVDLSSFFIIKLKCI